jgi:hypothetical protein
MAITTRGGATTTHAGSMASRKERHDSGAHTPNVLVIEVKLASDKVDTLWHKCPFHSAALETGRWKLKRR